MSQTQQKQGSKTIVGTREIQESSMEATDDVTVVTMLGLIQCLFQTNWTKNTKVDCIKKKSVVASGGQFDDEFAS